MPNISETRASTHVDQHGATPGYLSTGPAEAMPSSNAPLGSIEDRVRDATRGTSLGFALDGLSTDVRILTNRSDGNWSAVNSRKADWDSDLLDLGFRQARLAEDGHTLPADEVAHFDDRIARAKRAFTEARSTMEADGKALTVARAYYEEAISYLAANMEGVK